ncbi:MAG TPA: VirB3 family type IV secretion system protein [Stellaceae bacterium]|nr:VirB3 family type IV secretion system protein [Stellaceae bacterium]
MEQRINRVFRSMNRPLTILGAERRLFFLALMTGVGLFNFFGSLFAGLVAFIALWLLAAWSTRSDPQMLRILLNSARSRIRYDAAKHDIAQVRIVRHV